MNKRPSDDSGIALIVVLLLMLVFTVMLLGFYFETTGEQNVAYSDSDNAATFYAAQGAIENMSSALGQYFTDHASPTPTQIATLQGTSAAPTMAIYNTIGSLSGTNISFPVYSIVNLSSTNPSDPPCALTSLCNSTGTIPGTGPLSGLMGILTPFELTVVADGPGGSEVKMTRQVQVVAVPVFQFGIFSQTDLSFFAGPNFNFGGKTATNGNLFLAEGNGATLTLNDKVTAYLSVIREQLSNGTVTQPTNYPGSVDITVGAAGGCPTPTCGSCPTATCGVLLPAQGSVTGGPGSTATSNWNAISTTTYGGYIKTSTTGAKTLNLNLAAASSGTPLIDMVERGQSGDSSALVQERFFYQASVRVLLSDTASQITSLPTVTSNAPYPLSEQVTTAQSAIGSGMGSGSGTYIVRGTGTGSPNLPATDSCHPPVAQSPGWTADNDYYYTPYTTLVGGYIKVEIQLASGAWQDVTQEVLSLGISRDIQSSGTLSPSGCTNTSIIHLQEQKPLYYQSAPTVALASGTGLSTSDYYWYEVVPVVTINGVTNNVIPGEVAGGLKPTSSDKKMALTWTAFSDPSLTVTSYDVYCGSSTSATGGPGWVGYINVGNVTSYTDASCTTPTLTAGSPPTTFPTLLNTESGTDTATDYVPINMYDPREGEVRDSNSYTTVAMNGIMNVVEIDVGHLQQWLAGKLVPPVSGCSGTAAITPVTGTVNSCGPLAIGGSNTNSAGYLLYISDRRSNCNQSAAGPCTGTSGTDTGVYGYEDIINPASGVGTPNNTLDTGEDVNANGSLDVYGGTARPINCHNFDTSGATNYPVGASTTLAAGPSSGCSITAGSFMAGLVSPATPVTAPVVKRLNSAGVGLGYLEAQKNPVLFFRRAVRLVDGGLGNLPPYQYATLTTCPNMQSPAQYPSGGGFSVATEGPLYIWGDYNALTTNANGFSKDLTGQCHVPAAVYSDAVTLLSDNYTDSQEFFNPTAMSSRPQANTATWYRVAVIGGKNISFPLPTFTSPAAPPEDFGTDGGVHNFLRYIENWNTTLNYMGAMVSFYYSEQGTGVFKCCNTVYNPPTRAYSYDSDFTNVGSLPPAVPHFTDVNALSYNQATLATQ